MRLERSLLSLNLKMLQYLEWQNTFLKSWPNLASESRPRLNFITSTKRQQQNTDQTSASKSCLSFRTELMSEFLTRVAKQWADSGPIKTLEFDYFLRVVAFSTDFVWHGPFYLLYVIKPIWLICLTWLTLLVWLTYLLWIYRLDCKMARYLTRWLDG